MRFTLGELELELTDPTAIQISEELGLRILTAPHPFQASLTFRVIYRLQ
jgi:hypothetical protein